MKKTQLFLALLLLSYSSYGQDYHYWSEQFGTKSSFLGGATAAGIDDNSTVYYNSAAMAFIKDPSISVTINAYRFSTISMNNALGKGLSLKGNNLNIIPNMIAGILPLKKFPKLALGYSVLAKRYYKNKFNLFHRKEADIISTQPGDEIFLGNYYYNHELSEYWSGIAASYKVNEHMSFGLSHFGIYRNVKYTNQYGLNVLPSSGLPGHLSRISSNIIFNYWNVKIMFKASMALRFEKFRFGINFTTPTINVVGRAKVYREFSVINLPEIISSDLTVLSRENKIKATHKQASSIAVGFSFRLNKNNWIHFTNETFLPVKNYFIFEQNEDLSVFPTSITSDQIASVFGNQQFLSLQEQNKMVSNFGLGFQSQLKQTVGLYFGARTDFLHNADPYFQLSRLQVDASKWNLYHFSFGAEKWIKNKKYMAGIEFGLSGNNKINQSVNFENVVSETSITGTDDGTARVALYSFKFIFQITLGSPVVKK